MAMTPEDYYTAFVLGNQQDCTDNPACLRRAFNAAVSASHLADVYFAYHARHNPPLVSAFKNTAAFVKYVAEATNGAYSDIRSISNAYKHLYEERKGGKAPNWSVSSGGSLECIEFEGKSRPLQSLEADYAGPDPEHWKVVFRRRNGSQGEFLPTLAQVVGFWETKLWGP